MITIFLIIDFKLEKKKSRVGLTNSITRKC